MKKSNIITKIMLALVMVCLVFALVACGDSGGSSSGGKSSGKNNDKDKGGKTSGPTWVEQLQEIAGSVDGLLTEIGSIPEEKAAYLSLGIGVSYKNTDKEDSDKVSQGEFKLSLKGNVRESDPEIEVKFTAPNSNVSSKKNGGYEWFNLSVVDSTLYLLQPLTAVNTDNDVDKFKMNVSALAGEGKAIDNLMFVAIDAISDAIAGSGIADFKLGDMLSGDNSMLNSFSSALPITKTSTGWEIIATNELWGVLNTVVGLVPYVGDFIPDILTGLIGDDPNQYPTLKIVATKTDDVLSGLEIGYAFTNGDFGKITIDLALSTDSQKEVAINAPSYPDNALHANVTATAPLKGLQAALDAYLSPNLTKAEGNYLGYATLKAADKNGQNEVLSYGMVKDGLAAFDLAGAFTKLGKATTNATNYKANIQTVKEKQDGSLELGFPTVVKFFNDMAADFRADYLAHKDDEPEPTTVGTKNDPKKSMLLNIYLWLIGEEGKEAALRKLGSDADTKGVYSYNDPTETDMMIALKNKIGDYVNFEIDVEKAKQGKDPTNYLNTVKNIAKLLGENDEWICGFDVIDASKISSIKSWADFTEFENWLAGDDFSSISAWADSLDIPEQQNGYAKYGIVDWNTTTYRGGLVVYSAAKTYAPKNGETAMQPGDDLLDLINVFVKIPHGKDGEGNPTGFGPITVADVADLLNNNICKAAKYFGIEVAENYEFDNDVTNKSLTKQIIAKAIGYTATGDDAVTELINAGLYLEVGSEPNAGIYGFIAIYDVNESLTKGNVKYAQLEGSINFVADTVETEAKKVEADLIKETTVSLNGEPQAVLEDGEPTGEYEVVYPQAEECFDMLKDLWDGYVAYTPAA